jgi:aromatic-L-amino-acid decarboxylase
MSSDEFRRHGHAMVDWIADYLDGVADRRIVPDVAPGDIRARLPAAAPEHPEPFEALMRDLDEIVMDGITHWQSPGWFAYFPANSSPPAVLGEMASAGLAVQGMLWSTSPACTEIEQLVLDWLVDLLGLPVGWKSTGPGGGVIQMSASDSTHTALVVARHRAGEPVDDQVAYASAEAHSSVEKGARVAGFGHFRPVAVDASFAMVPEALEEAVRTDLARGLRPTFVNSTVGTTATTAVDPLRAVGEVAGRHGLWHHVDAAYAGSAMICPEFRHHQDGVELADSYVFNHHKWLFTNFDCSAFYVADRAPLLAALDILPPYLRSPASAAGTAVDYRNWHVPMGRRFRALKLWFVLRSYGAEGLRHHLREHVRLAADLAARLEADSRFVLVAPAPFALVSFRHAAGDAATGALSEAINASGHSYVTTSESGGRAFIRVSVGQTHTERRHVERLWRLIDEKAPAAGG